MEVLESIGRTETEEEAIADTGVALLFPFDLLRALFVAAPPDVDGSLEDVCTGGGFA